MTSVIWLKKPRPACEGGKGHEETGRVVDFARSNLPRMGVFADWSG